MNHYRNAIIAALGIVLSLSGCSSGGSGASGGNSAPVAVIGAADVVKTGAIVLLNGSSSADADGDALTFSWRLTGRPAGSSAALSDDTAAITTFTADMAGEYSFELTVSDSAAASGSAEGMVTALAFSGTEVFVNGANATAGTGTQSDPFKTIQSAVSFASPDDIIRVAEGTYAGPVLIPGNKPLQIFGGYQNGNYSVRNTSTYMTRVQGSGSGAVITMNYSGSDGSRDYLRIDGLTVDSGDRGIWVKSGGNGGVLDVTIANNIIEDNAGLTERDDFGGGIFVDGTVPVITGNIIRQNQCGRGAGIAVNLRDIAEAVLIDGNTISDNIGHDDHGGGIYLVVMRGVFSNNIVRGNRIGETVDYGWGGGIIVNGENSSAYSDTVYLSMSGNVYSENYAPSIGGGVFIDEGANVRMSRELIVKNTIAAADKGGAGLYVDGPAGTSAARTVLSYCTIADNTGPSGSLGNAIYVEGNSTVTAARCIFWGNLSDVAADFFVDAGSSLTVSGSTYQHGYSGTGSVSIITSQTDNPGFINAAGGDYHAALTDRGVYGL